MKKIVIVLLFSLGLLLLPGSGTCAGADLKLVTRVETVTAQMKGRNLVIHAVGMGRTPAMIRGRGQLRPHSPNHEPNKDGLLEYDFYFNAPPNYSGFKLKAVKASLKESSVPAGVTGVRVFGEFNQIDRKFPEKKKKKKKEE